MQDPGMPSYQSGFDIPLPSVEGFVNEEVSDSACQAHVVLARRFEIKLLTGKGFR